MHALVLDNALGCYARLSQLPLVQPLMRRMSLSHQYQSLLQLLIQQHQRSERIAQIAVTSGNDLIDRQLILIKSRVRALAWHAGQHSNRNLSRSCHHTGIFPAIHKQHTFSRSYNLHG
ncbi:hypothetical protein XI06_07355 [Bradyrhizobium sp. CCBAU 11434]|nr:hypothetical protein [Bradyrhizobium sp. CCBAU 11434]